MAEAGPHSAVNGDGSAIVGMACIDKSFPGVRARRGAGFDLQAGETHALRKALTGDNPPYAGENLIEAKPVTTPNPRAARILAVSIIHQEPQLTSPLLAAPSDAVRRDVAHCSQNRKRFGLVTTATSVGASVTLASWPRPSVGKDRHPCRMSNHPP